MAKKTVKKKASSTTAKTVKKAAKKTKKKSTRKKKSAAEARKRLVWVIFNNNMKEEGRFPFDQRKEAEKKLTQLSQKSKKPFFIQPVKEIISDGAQIKAKPGEDSSVVKDSDSEEE